MRAWILAAFLPSLVWAQGQGRLLPPRERKAPAGEEEGPLAQPLFEIRLGRIREVLGLPEDRSRAIAQRWGAYDREFMQNARQIQQIRQRFQEILISPGSEEEKNARMKPLLEQFLDHRKRQVEAKSRFEEDIRAQLSPAQQARLIMLVDNLSQRIQDLIRNRPGIARRLQGQRD